LAGLSREEFDQVAKEIQEAWSRADSRDAGFQVIVDYGRKYGYKNVIAAIQSRTPKRFSREQPLSQWVDERREEEAGA
jgi:hypothetical protein